MGKLDYERYLDLLEIVDVDQKGNVFYRKNGRRVPVQEDPVTHYLRGLVWDAKANKRLHFLVHTLVAARWLPQPTSLEVEISHVDQSRTNNHAVNLQWVSSKVNNNMPLRKKRRSTANDPKKKKVAQYDLHGNFIAEFESTCAAARSVNEDRRHIRDCCHGKRNTAYGYVWKFA